MNRCSYFSALFHVGPHQVMPTLKFTHVYVRKGLQAFGRVYPSRIGSQYPDILYSSISLSLRVLLSHFRKCARHPECWQTAKNTYRGDGCLESVAEVLKTIKIVP